MIICHYFIYPNQFNKLNLLLKSIRVKYKQGIKNKVITEEITETNYVTKKDVYLYNDIIEKTIIDEIPAFVKIKTYEKSTLVINRSKNKTYYKTDFNKNSGWVDSIYLANLDQNKKESTDLSHSSID